MTERPEQSPSPQGRVPAGAGRPDPGVPGAGGSDRMGEAPFGTEASDAEGVASDPRATDPVGAEQVEPVPEESETGSAGAEWIEPESAGPEVAGRNDLTGEVSEADASEDDPTPTLPASDSEVFEGEIVEPSTSEAAEADALLAEALDGDSIEAQFMAAEADLAAAGGVTGGADSAQVAALIADLQRVHAEYSNYRKRVERDRELVRERAVESAVVELLPILDDIGRARDHDELVGGFRSVGEALEAAVARLGLTAFGAVGEAFDPMRHEALMREEREGVTEPTVVTILQAGYEMNGRVVRPARVSVAGTD